MQNASRSFACIESTRLREHALRIEIHNRVEHRIQSLNLPDMRLGELNHGHSACTDNLQLPRGRGQHQLIHERQPSQAPQYPPE